MASDREAAKNAIRSKSSSDPELEDAIKSGHQLQLEMAKENNRHNETMRSKEIGLLGKMFGAEKSAPANIAVVVLLACLVGAGFCIYQASAAKDAALAEFWSKQIERSLAFAGIALSYIFGRGGK